MRTVTLQSLLLRAWQRVGNDAADVANIPSGARTMLVAAANDAIEQCWTWSDWPELCRVEERTVEGNATTGFYLSYEQPGETPMGEVFAIYRDNPNTHVAPRQFQYSLLADQVRFPDAQDVPATVWVRYRLRPTEYSTGNLTATVPAVLAKAVGLNAAAQILPVATAIESQIAQQPTQEETAQ